MRLDEYVRHDAVGLGALVNRGEVTPRELAMAATEAIAKVNPTLNAVVETYADRTQDLDEATLGDGPFRGVPFLMKDVFGHEAGRRIEFGSRLCEGMVAQQDTVYTQLVKAAGVNVIGRSAAPEYSMAGTTETALYGNTSTPWKYGYSAGGSSGGAMAAVVAGMVPIAQGTDIAGSIRIPASFCGGVGLKPSRGRISFAPMLDENGYGLAQNFVQTRTVRDAATMLDCLAMPQPGDPFLIPRPTQPWAELARHAPPRLRVGYCVAPLMGVTADPEVTEAVRRTAQALAAQGHMVEEVDPSFDGEAAMQAMMVLWFFGFEARLAGYAARSGRPVSEQTLEPVTWQVLQRARTLTAVDFLAAMGRLNTARRQLGQVFTRCDLWVTPSTARAAEPWGLYNLGRTGLVYEDIANAILAPVAQYTLPHNIMGTPAISLPLAMHTSGLPIGVQLAAAPAQEHLLLQLATYFETTEPWAARVPPIHVSG